MAALVNPWHGIGGDFATNCILAAMGADMTLEDGGTYRHQVPPSGPMALGDLVAYANDPARAVPRPAEQFAFVHTTVDEVRRALAGAEPFERGFVAVPGYPGHVVNAVQLPDGPALLDGQLGKLVDLGGDTPVYFLPLTTGVVVTGPVVDRELLIVQEAGAAGFEVETAIALADPGRTRDEMWALGPLARGANTKIVVDRTGGRWIFEIVSAPARVSPRETSRSSVEEVVTEARAALNALARGSGRTLADALSGTDFVVTGDGADIRIGELPRGQAADVVHPQLTIGLPLSEVYRYFVDRVRDLDAQDMSRLILAPVARQSHAAGIRFAAGAIGRFVGRADDSPLDPRALAEENDPVTASLLGFLTLAYTQAATVMIAAQADKVLPKNAAVYASRTALHTIRAALPADARAWVEANWSELASLIIAYRETIQELNGDPVESGRLARLRMPIEDGSGGSYTVQEYLESILRPNAARLIDQHQALDIRTHFTEMDDGGGAFHHSPMVVLERRLNPGGRRSFDEVVAEFRTVVEDLGGRVERVRERESRISAARRGPMALTSEATPSTLPRPRDGQWVSRVGSSSRTAPPQVATGAEWPVDEQAVRAAGEPPIPASVSLMTQLLDRRGATVSRETYPMWLVERRFPAGVTDRPNGDLVDASAWVRQHIDEPGEAGLHRLSS
ncbi:hypothetical protein AB0J83_17455 [Actinoplanes sp. NPDC049596]|uniref:hypothetical protein n=1 Tax=unclassified Actinoplanes TaxID=2626549 RepID=UPI003447FD25